MANARGRTAPRTRRKTFWDGQVFTLEPTTGVRNAVTIIAEAVLENVPNATLVRMRGNGLVMVEAIGAAGASAVVGMGIIAVNGNAFAAGAASLPSPVNDVGTSWIWQDWYPLHVNNALETSGLLGTQALRFQIDNKAMRKMSVNEVLVMVVENFVISGTMTVTVQGAVRILFKR